KRVLNVADGVADRNRTVVKHGELNRRRELRLEGRKDLPNRVDDLDGVRSRLALHAEHDAAGTVVPRRDFVVLHAVEYPPDFVESHWGAVAIGDDDRRV